MLIFRLFHWACFCWVAISVRCKKKISSVFPWHFISSFLWYNFARANVLTYFWTFGEDNYLAIFTKSWVEPTLHPPDIKKRMGRLWSEENSQFVESWLLRLTLNAWSFSVLFWKLADKLIYSGWHWRKDWQIDLSVEKLFDSNIEIFGSHGRSIYIWRGKLELKNPVFVIIRLFSGSAQWKSFPTPGISITINFLSPQLHWYLISQTYSCTPILCRWRRLEGG